jgi:hypothetical protein
MISVNELTPLVGLHPPLPGRYAHTLLFNCLDCALPVSVARISETKDPEPIAAQTIKLHCSYCGKRFVMPGVAAKMHWVSDWSSL